MVWLMEPRIKIASSAWPIAAKSQSSVRSERMPSSTYVIGLKWATQRIHGVRFSSGTVDEVRNANGKNKMKLDATAPGFAVFNAIA